MSKGNIFILNIHTYCDHRYPKYNVYKWPNYYLSSLQEAEDKINGYTNGEIELWSYIDKIHHFTVTEVKYESFENQYSCIRIYDHNGNLIDHTLCPGDCEPGDFKGRTHDKIRFSIGEIAEVYYEHRNESELGLIVACPIDEFCTQGKELDFSDDFYMVYINRLSKAPLDVDPLSIFKPLFKIPTPTLNRLQREYQQFLEVETEWLKKTYNGKTLIILNEKLGTELLLNRFTRQKPLFKFTIPFPMALIDFLNRDIKLNKDNHSFVDIDGKTKFAFIVDNEEDIPSEFKKSIEMKKIGK